MISVAAGKYYGLNAVAARIWELLEKPQTVPQLCRQIVKEFEVDLPVCEPAVRDFVGDMLNNGILLESEA